MAARVFFSLETRPEDSALGCQDRNKMRWKNTFPDAIIDIKERKKNMATLSSNLNWLFSPFPECNVVTDRYVYKVKRLQLRNRKWQDASASKSLQLGGTD